MPGRFVQRRGLRRRGSRGLWKNGSRLCPGQFGLSDSARG